jgi:hypothetical protein
LNQNKSIA